MASTRTDYGRSDGQLTGPDYALRAQRCRWAAVPPATTFRLEFMVNGALDHCDADTITIAMGSMPAIKVAGVVFIDDGTDHPGIRRDATELTLRPHSESPPA